MEERLFAHRRDLSTQLKLMFMDTPASLRRRRWADPGPGRPQKDHRPDLWQMILAVRLDGGGVRCPRISGSQGSRVSQASVRFSFWPYGSQLPCDWRLNRLAVGARARASSSARCRVGFSTLTHWIGRWRSRSRPPLTVTAIALASSLHPRIREPGGVVRRNAKEIAGAALMRCDGHAVCTVLHQMLAAVFFVVAGAAIFPPLWRSFSTGARRSSRARRAPRSNAGRRPRRCVVSAHPSFRTARGAPRLSLNPKQRSPQ